MSSDEVATLRVELGSALQRARKAENGAEVMQDDLAALLRALGMGDHARPQSPHEVMLEAVAEAAQLTRLSHQQAETIRRNFDQYAAWYREEGKLIAQREEAINNMDESDIALDDAQRRVAQLKAERDEANEALAACQAQAGGRIGELEKALRGLLADIEEYQEINHLGGRNNHWQVMARAALSRGSEPKPEQKVDSCPNCGLLGPHACS